MPSISINGDLYSWASHELLLAGIYKVRGCVALDFADKLDSQLVWADNQDGTPVGSTYGQYKADDTTVEILRTFSVAFEAQLAALGIAATGSARFTMASKLYEPPANTDVTTLSKCRLLGQNDSRQKGTDALTTKYTIQITTIDRNGLTLFDRTRGLL